MDLNGEIMSKQTNIPGLETMRVLVPLKRVGDLSRQIGALIALDKVADEIRKMKKEHPVVPGLTLALAITEKHVAQAQLANSRLVLRLACSAEMDIEGMATTVELRDDGLLDLVSYRAEEESEGSAA